MKMNNGTMRSTNELVRIRGGMCKTKPVDYSSGRCGNVRISLHRGDILRLMRRIVIRPFFIFRPYYPLTLLSGFFFNRNFGFSTYYPAPFFAFGGDF